MGSEHGRNIVNKESNGLKYNRRSSWSKGMESGLCSKCDGTSLEVLMKGGGDDMIRFVLLNSCSGCCMENG